MTSLPPNPDERPSVDSAKESHSTPDKLVLLSTFTNTHEAHLFRIELEQHGIEATVANELTTPLFGATIAGPSSAFWIEVLVLEADVEKALEIKNQFAPDGNEEIVIPAWTCDCGETVDAGFAMCWACSADYSGPDDV